MAVTSPSAVLNATPAQIRSGQSSTLSWQAEGMAFVSLDGVGQVPPTGTLNVTPTATTTYRLTGRGPAGVLVSEASVTVVPPPPTAALIAASSAITVGDSTLLTWTTTGATAVTLDGASVTADGSMAVHPTETTVYKLIATNAGGSQEADVQISVSAALLPVQPPTTLVVTPPSPPNPATSAPTNMFMPPAPGAVTLSSAVVDCAHAAGVDAGEKIANCIAALPTSGGTADATGLQGTQNIHTNVFLAANGSGKLLLGAATVSVCQTQTVPSNWEIAGQGQTTVLIACPNNDLGGPTHALISNRHNVNYDAKDNHDHNIVVHDLVVDGNSATNVAIATQGVVFLGVDYSEIYHVTVQNTSRNGLDVRDGFGNKVHDNTALNAGQFEPYHSIGGGLSQAGMLFNGNSFANNKASGGNNVDHYDIFGQYGTCVGNDFVGNESDHAPLQGLIYDTCSWGRIQNNTVTDSAKDALAITSGSGAQLSENLLVSNNNLVRSLGNGIMLKNQVNFITISNNTIQAAAWNGIYVIQSSGNEIAANNITAPGASWTQHFSGIEVTTATIGYAAQNYIHDNTISDACAQTMLYGISLQEQNGGQVFNNVVNNNGTTGGSAGNTGNGINDFGTSTVLSGNHYSVQTCP